MITGQIYEYLLDALSFILVLGVAVVIHEAGHFIIARFSGIRVEKFSIGFGKALFSFKRGETEYILAPIPMGGYVKLAGDNPAEITGKPDEFYSISPWRRIPTVIAGPAANLIGAFLILFGLAFLFGKSYDYNVVGTVISGSIEDRVGIKKNDILFSVNGETIQTWKDYQNEVSLARDFGKTEVELQVKRGEQILPLILPISREEIDKCMVISFVDPVGPAFSLGLKEGDRMIGIAGQEPQTWSEFREITTGLWESSPSGPLARSVTLKWETGGEIRSASITPAIVKNETGETVALLGVAQAAMGMTPRVPPIVRRIARGFPAAGIPLKPGAQIISVNGQVVDTADEVEKVVSFSYTLDTQEQEPQVTPQPIELTWKNPGEEAVQSAQLLPQVEMTPFRSEIGLQLAIEFPLARLGISFQEPSRPLGLLESLGEGVRGTAEACAETWFVLKGLFTGQVNKRLIGGPVAILQLSARVGKEGLRRLLWFCAFLQANLALLNLLPIPVLDGGHLIVALCEGVSRRTFSLKTREIIQNIGLVILIPLFVFVFINDFSRLGMFKWIKEILP